MALNGRRAALGAENDAWVKELEKQVKAQAVLIKQLQDALKTRRGATK